MTKYKVWLHVEKINEEKDHYEDQGMPELLGEFLRMKGAERLVHFLKLQAEDVFPFL